MEAAGSSGTVLSSTVNHDLAISQSNLLFIVIISVSALLESTSSLVVQRTRLSTIGDRAFPVAAARPWNTAAERHVGVVSVCFHETFEDPSLSHSFHESPVVPLQ